MGRMPVDVFIKNSERFVTHRGIGSISTTTNPTGNTMKTRFKRSLAPLTIEEYDDIYGLGEMEVTEKRWKG